VSLPPSLPLHSEAEQIELLKKQLQWAEWKIRALEERLRLELIEKYGPKSEKLSDAQLELLQLEPGVSAAEVEAESERQPMPPASCVHGGRQKKPQASGTTGTAS
jgi:predicted  nucleic acid-binding Zn-ribbon protein